MNKNETEILRRVDAATPATGGTMTTITDADRIAAAAVAVLPEMRDLILAGRADHHAEPFARHRQEALKQALKIARAAQYSPSPATDTVRGIEGLMAYQNSC